MSALLAGGAMMAGGALGSLFGPKRDKLEMPDFAELSAAIQRVMSLPQYQELFSNLNRGTTATLGRTRREGSMAIRDTGVDPARVAKGIGRLFSSTAATGVTQGATNLGKAVQIDAQTASILGQLAATKDTMKLDVNKYNLMIDIMNQQDMYDLNNALMSVGGNIFASGLSLPSPTK